MKVVINRCYGGFSVSAAVMERLGLPLTFADEVAAGREYSRNCNFLYGVERNDPRLVAAVEELGEAANGTHSELKVVEVPDGVRWHIEEYDGWESIHEDHRAWG